MNESRHVASTRAQRRARCTSGNFLGRKKLHERPCCSFVHNFVMYSARASSSRSNGKRNHALLGSFPRRRPRERRLLFPPTSASSCRRRAHVHPRYRRTVPERDQTRKGGRGGTKTPSRGVTTSVFIATPCTFAARRNHGFRFGLTNEARRTHEHSALVSPCLNGDRIYYSTVGVGAAASRRVVSRQMYSMHSTCRA